MWTELDLVILIILLVAWSVIMFIAYKMRPRKNFVKVKATVTGMDSHMSSVNRTGRKIEVFRPEFTYEWEGWTRTISSDVYSSFADYELGEEVDIYINTLNPSEFRYKDNIGLIYLLGWMLGVIVIIAILHG